MDLSCNQVKALSKNFKRVVVDKPRQIAFEVFSDVLCSGLGSFRITSFSGMPTYARYALQLAVS